MSFFKGLGLCLLLGFACDFFLAGGPLVVSVVAPPILFITIYLAIRAGVSTQTVIKKVVR